MMMLLPPRSKQVIACFIVAIFLLEIRNGYFKRLPAYLKSCDYKSLLLFVGGALVVALCIMPADTVLLKTVQQFEGQNWHKQIMDWAMWLVKNIWILLIFAYLLSALTRIRVLPRLIFSAIFSNVVVGLLTTIFKFGFARARPDKGMGPYSFFNWAQVKVGYYQSFSSGDAAMLAAIMVFFFYTLRRLPFRAVFLLLPAIVAYARVGLNRHWPSDVILSMGLGLAAAHWVAGYYRFDEPVKIPAGARR